jgi:hypothetical protein
MHNTCIGYYEILLRTRTFQSTLKATDEKFAWGQCHWILENWVSLNFLTTCMTIDMYIFWEKMTVVVVDLCSTYRRRATTRTQTIRILGLWHRQSWETKDMRLEEIQVSLSCVYGSKLENDAAAAAAALNIINFVQHRIHRYREGGILVPSCLYRSTPPDTIWTNLYLSLSWTISHRRSCIKNLTSGGQNLIPVKFQLNPYSSSLVIWANPTQ